ncbi:MAG: hypothetical protein EBU08_15150 [Micrococcales bacterium]|nr:hypothetical protein [Micrococcales bacterium]
MITKEMIEKVAVRFLGEKEMIVSRANGGFASPCGYQLTVVLENDIVQTFFHDGNTEQTLVSKMIPFVEMVEEMELTSL